MTLKWCEIKPVSGTYALILQAVRKQTIEIGKLGKLRVCPGFYIYIGSAFGSGGLQARIGHHLRQTKVLHWHIDYLKQAAIIKEVWFSYQPASQEHAWATAFQSLPDAAIPLPGFGSSDCPCASHLFYFEKGIPADILLEHERKVF
jgi:Uri superfamily endonuclease